jgi:hypothetical protein
MNGETGLLGSGLGRVMRNLRFIFWFWLLSLVFAGFGTVSFRESAHAILDHSLYAGRLTHGFDLSVYIELLMRPEFGPLNSMTFPAMYFAFMFFVATALFLPGVFAAYASTYRFPRQDFFRACGRNLWRFIRLMILSGIVMGIFAGILFSVQGAIVKKAGDSTGELLPVILQLVGLAVIFLVMTVLRIWFDLAEADMVLNDQRAVRKSIAAGFRHTFRNLSRLLGSYIFTTMVAGIFLLAGLACWLHFVPADALWRALLVGQVTMLLLLIPRFWQRGVAVSYWQQHMLVPVVAVLPVEPTVVPAQVVVEPAPAIPPLIPPPAPEPSTT